MADQFRPGNVNLLKCTLSSLKGNNKLDITPQVITIDVYESMTDPVITADFGIADGIGLLSSFPIIGEEIIDLSFETPTLDVLKYSLRVFQITDVQADDINKINTYCLSAVSKEGFTNNTKVVTRKFNQEISKSITELVTNDLASSKKISIESTIGIDNHLISNITPLEAIDKLRHRAVSAQYKSSSFCFYEDSDGFHFATIEKMMKDAKAAKVAWTFDNTYQTDIMTEERFRSMISYVPVQTVNSIDKLQYGGVANAIKQFDILTGEITEVKYKDAGNSFEKTGKVSRENSSTFASQYGQTTGVKRLFPLTGDNAHHMIEKTSNLPGFVNKINQNIVNGVVWGDSTLRIGMPVQVQVLKSTGLTNKDNNSTNNYIISKIRHIILNSHAPVYTQAVEIIGNSYAQ